MSDNEIILYLKRIQGRIRGCNIILVILYIAIPVLFFKTFIDFTMSRNFVFCLVVTVAVCIFIGPLAKKQKKLNAEKKDFIGENIVKPVLSEKIEVKEYLPNSFVSRDIIKNSSIMPGYDEITGSDYVKGTYRGVEIVFSDITLTYVDRYRDDDGRRRTRRTVVFKGHFFRMTLGKKLDGYVRIMERKNPRKTGFLADLFNSTAELVGMKSNTIEVESETFNNQFEIKTNDDELAFYILTPQFMENIVRADELANGYTNILFKNNHVDLSMNNYVDSFEVTRNISGKKALDECRMAMRKDLNIILAIADEILTKDRIFS